MTEPSISDRSEKSPPPGKQPWLWPLALFSAAVLVRLYFAIRLFLNPDEALHYLLSVQPSLGAAYQASLTTAHPPLLILFLYYWRALGHSELILRLPFVLAGLLFCWIAWKWIERIANRDIAQIALPLLLFAPPLISLSAEVRQYAFLLLFISLALYCFERAIEESSTGWMILFSLALYGALLVHYSGFFFCLAIGCYAVIRFLRRNPSASVLFPWVLGQVVAAALVVFLYRTHIATLKKSDLPQTIADTWLRKSIFHPTEDNALWFIVRGTIRFFHFLFGNGAVGALALIGFLTGWAALLAGTSRMAQLRTNPRMLALMLSFPFAAAIAASIAGAYPYGGTRHDVFLAPFAVVAISGALSLWQPDRRWVRPLIVLLALLAANLFLSPSGPFIKPANQTRSQMEGAIAFVRSHPASLVFTDYQGGQVLSYYLCDQSAVQLSLPPYQPFTRTDCKGQTVIATSPDIWIFHADDFPGALREMTHRYPQDAARDIVVFQAGWSVEKEDDVLRVFRGLGCTAPLHYGRNILICSLEQAAEADR